MCGTAAEIIAIRELDFRTIGAGRMGPVAAQVQKVFHETATGKGARSDEWLTSVNA